MMISLWFAVYESLPVRVITLSLSMNRRLTQLGLRARFYAIDLNQFSQTGIRNNS
jgi:hypothetical protein